MEYWDENTVSCIKCLRSLVGICPMLYLTFLPYCVNSETALPLVFYRPQTCPSGSATTWEEQQWRCTQSTCPLPSMAWHSLKLLSKSPPPLSLSLNRGSCHLVSMTVILPHSNIERFTGMNDPLFKSDILIPWWNFIVAEYIFKKRLDDTHCWRIQALNCFKLLILLVLELNVLC